MHHKYATRVGVTFSVLSAVYSVLYTESKEIAGAQFTHVNKADSERFCFSWILIIILTIKGKRDRLMFHTSMNVYL